MYVLLCNKFFSRSWKIDLMNILDKYKNIKLDKIENYEKYDIIIPLKFDDIFYIHHNKYFFEKQNKIILSPSLQSYELCNDKIKFVRYFSDFYNYLEYLPKTYVIKLNSDIIVNSSIQYPAILKPQYSSQSQGIILIKNQEDYQKYQFLDNYLIQEYIINKYEYLGNFIVYNGKIYSKLYLVEKYNNDFYIKNGSMENYKIINEMNKNHIINTQIFEDIFTQINYSGFACINFKIIKNKIKIFEINPRPGGTIMKNTDLFIFLINDFITTKEQKNFKL